MYTYRAEPNIDEHEPAITIIIYEVSTEYGCKVQNGGSEWR